MATTNLGSDAGRSVQLINALKAESLIAGTWILEEVTKLGKDLQYKSDEETVSYPHYYRSLLTAADRIPMIKLDAVVTPGTARPYLINLLTSLEEVLDQIEVVSTKILFFQAKVKAAKTNIKNLASTFSAWYLIVLQQELRRLELKLASSSLNHIAESEFTRLLGESASDLDALDGALVLLMDRLKAKKKLAMDKFSLGKEQANMSFIPDAFTGPQTGYDYDNPTGGLLRDRYGLGASPEQAPKNNTTTPFPMDGEEDPDEEDLQNIRRLEALRHTEPEEFQAADDTVELEIEDQPKLEPDADPEPEPESELPPAVPPSPKLVAAAKDFQKYIPPQDKVEDGEIEIEVDTPTTTPQNKPEVVEIEVEPPPMQFTPTATSFVDVVKPKPKSTQKISDDGEIEIEVEEDPKPLRYSDTVTETGEMLPLPPTSKTAPTLTDEEDEDNFSVKLQQRLAKPTSKVPVVDPFDEVETVSPLNKVATPEQKPSNLETEKVVKTSSHTPTRRVLSFEDDCPF